MIGYCKYSRSLCLVVVTLSLAACSGGNVTGGIASNNFAPTDPQPAKSDKITGKGAAEAEKIFATKGQPQNGAGVADYRISGLDVLQITVLGLKDLDTTVQVSSSGMITLPLVKTVKAGGQTTAELEQEIAKRLQVTYLQSPQVSVFVKEYNSQRVTVDGSVVKPGIFPIMGSMSLLQAIALAQGLDRVADPSAVIIFRQVSDRRMAAKFDLRQIRGGKVSDPNLLAGDVVMVDQSTSRSTLRDVNESIGVFSFFKFL